ncbi:nitrogen permease regulator 3, partial [Streptomyces albidoflavus]
MVNNKRKSFQIPVKLEFSSLPEPTVPYIPGSHLSSTANMLSSTGLVNLGETTRYHTKGLMNLLLDGSLATGNYGA